MPLNRWRSLLDSGMARSLRYSSIAALVLAAALGGYFVGKLHERRLQSTRTVSLETESTGMPSVHSERKARGSETTDSAEREQLSAPSLAALLAEARRRLDGGGINIGSIVEVFDSMGALDPEQMTEVMRLIDEMPNFQQENIHAMLGHMAHSDPAKASSLVEKLGTGGIRRPLEALSTLLD